MEAKIGPDRGWLSGPPSNILEGENEGVKTTVLQYLRN